MPRPVRFLLLGNGRVAQPHGDGTVVSGGTLAVTRNGSRILGRAKKTSTVIVHSGTPTLGR